MSNYTAAVEFFSSLCQTQLNQPLSRLDAANDGLGATLVLLLEPCQLVILRCFDIVLVLNKLFF